MCHADLAQRLPDRFLANPETRRTFILIGVRIVAHVLRKFVGVDLPDFATFIWFGVKALPPTLERGNPNTETFGCFFKGKPFFLSNRKDMAAKANWIRHTSCNIINLPLGYMLVRVALANKMARTVWALMAHGEEYRGQVVTR